MTKKQKKVLIRIVISAVLFAAACVLFRFGPLSYCEGTYTEGICFLAIYLIAGTDVLIRAAKNISHGKVFDENFLMIIAGIGAFVIGEYSEGVAVILFYQVGELFQSYAVGKSRQSISDMMDIVPEYVNVVDENGTITEEDPEDVPSGSVILIRPGEKVPIDCRVIEGDSYLDTSALTGESVPRHAGPGTELLSGSVNSDGSLKCVTIRAYVDSAVSVILELVENAGSRKSSTERFITKFAKYYTPVVTIGAILLAVIPSVVTGSPWEWIRRACTFLVISCPCALVISVPLGFFGGIGGASRIGVLIKGSNFIEAVSRADTIAFDKTGTLTKGKFEVSRIVPSGSGPDGAGYDDKALLTIAAAVEQFSDHPIAVSIMSRYKEMSAYDTAARLSLPDIGTASHAVNTPGKGLSAVYGGETILAGNSGMMIGNEVKGFVTGPMENEGGTICHIAYAGTYAGYIEICDTVKENAAEQILAMKLSGISKTVMLTGDNDATAMKIAAETKVDAYFSRLLPQDKVGMVEELLEGITPGKKLLYVGDGINDAPVLMRADVGIAMGSLGSDAAIEAADIVIMDDDLSKIPMLLRICRRTMRIVRENIVFALGVKLLILVLGAFGIAGMWLAVFADVGVAVLAILNSMRAMRIRNI